MKAAKDNDAEALDRAGNRSILLGAGLTDA
jgi:hypothetical protein